MKTKKFLTMLAAMLLTSVCAFAQSENGEQAQRNKELSNHFFHNCYFWD